MALCIQMMLVVSSLSVFSRRGLLAFFRRSRPRRSGTVTPKRLLGQSLQRLLGQSLLNIYKSMTYILSSSPEADGLIN